MRMQHSIVVKPTSDATKDDYSSPDSLHIQRQLTNILLFVVLSAVKIASRTAHQTKEVASEIWCSKPFPTYCYYYLPFLTTLDDRFQRYLASSMSVYPHLRLDNSIFSESEGSIVIII